MPEMVEALDRGDDLKHVPGLLLNRPHGPVHTGEAARRKDLDSLPLPARHLISHYAPHYYINFRKPLALMETARGCPFKCNFCSVWKFHESTFREKSPARVVEELSHVAAPNIFLTDDIFWMNVKRGRDLARALIDSGIRKHYTLQTRSDIITRFPDLVAMWRECGELSVFLGLEKIDDAGLASVNKNNTAANNERALEILADLGVGYTPNFIVDPSWERSDFDKLKRWIDKTGAYNSGFSVLTPLPGTDLWDTAKQRVNTQNWEMYDLIHAVLPTNLPLDEFYEEYSGLWRHALDVRYRHRGKVRTYVQLGGALLTGKVSLDAVRKGMNMAKVFSKPETFLRAHQAAPAALVPAP
jgi:radical SAM superfamily enzyme YgiQ (UPF0313 family)